MTFESFNPDTKAVTVNHTGDVYWYTLATTKSSCTVLVRYYPFDKQTCELTFTTWLYQTNEQIFYAVSDILENGAYKSYEIFNAQWSVVVDTVEVGNATYECITCIGQEQSFVYYKLILIRGQHWLYFFNIILPCFVMSAMTLIVIWLPEKDVAGAASLGVTCILAFFVFLTFLFTQLPATGIPLIGKCLSLESFLKTS
ncbi:Neuronal acetylcholine receptor subunit alpha-10 [Holothuria leucospilota]|uniref:Neuronal acetylcholine receptor subunit alpha-10 n=1 Tax=Holothuria leucospilota TaxID=206669 RepID=A0A9Q1HIA5_HOLLE|nr:Neuronal acetylcholine receptor subunit alpha-10 [Holothuria leucospilota]